MRDVFSMLKNPQSNMKCKKKKIYITYSMLHWNCMSSYYFSIFFYFAFNSCYFVAVVSKK